MEPSLAATTRFVCSGSQAGRSKVTLACVQSGCIQQPFICGEENCQCQALHTSHRIFFMRGVFDKANQAPKTDPGMLAVYKGMSTAIDSVIVQLNNLKRFHEQQVGAYTASTYRWQEARTRLLAQDNSYPFTGDVLCNMLEEMDDVKKIQSPYTLSEEQIKSELVPQITSQVDRLLKTIKDTWRFPQKKAEDQKEKDKAASPLKGIKIINRSRIPGVQAKIFEGREVSSSDIQTLENTTSSLTIRQCSCPNWPEFFALLANSKHLVQLSLVGCQLSPESIAAIGKMLQITSLIIDNCSLQKSELSKLHSLTKLVHLTIVNNPINDMTEDQPIFSLVRHLSALQTLEFPLLKLLKVYQYNDDTVNDRESQFVTKNTPNTQQLTLAYNKVTESAKAAALSRLHKLTKVKFDGRPITSTTADALAKYAPNLKELSLESGGISDSSVVTIASSLKELIKLELWSGKIGLEGCKSIAKLSNLTHLHIPNNPLGDEGIVALSNGLCRLTYLHIRYTNAGPLGIVAILKNNPSIAELNIGNLTIDAKVLECIGNLKDLLKLYAVETKITEEQALKLAKSLPHLKTMSLSGNGLKEIAKTNLQKILQKCDISV